MTEWFIPVIWHEGKLWSEHSYETEKDMRSDMIAYGNTLLGFIRVGRNTSWHKVAAEIPSKHDWYFVIKADERGNYHAEHNGNEDWFYSDFLPDEHENDYECVIVGAGGKHSAVVSTQSMWLEAKADGAYEPYERHY